MQASLPGLDVLIPHRDDPEGLALSLSSVAAQSWRGPVRVVIADDGSENASRRKLAELVGQTDLPVETITIAHNMGRPYARNALLDAINSPFVAWLDAGDEWYPDKLQLQFAAAARDEGPEPYWVTSNYDWQAVGAPLRPVVQDTSQDQLRALLMGRTLRAYLWTILAPARFIKAVGRFDEKLPRLQDLDFFLRFVADGGRLISPATQDPLCVYHKSYLGRSAREVRACNAYLFRKHRQAYDRYGPEFRSARIYEMELLSARLAIENRQHLDSLRYLARAFVRSPATLARRLFAHGRSL